LRHARPAGELGVAIDDLGDGRAGDEEVVHLSAIPFTVDIQGMVLFWPRLMVWVNVVLRKTP